MPIQDYDPLHLDVWRKAGLEKVVLSPLEYAQAIALRSKLYRLRRKLEKDKDPEVQSIFSLARMVTIKLYPTWPDGPTGPSVFNLMLHPTNQEFEQALANAGIKNDEPPPLD